MIRSYLRLVKVSVFLSLILPIVVRACGRAAIEGLSSSKFYVKSLLALFAVLVVYKLFLRFVRYAFRSINRISEKQGAYLDDIPITYVDAAILISAAASLFLELSVIRWQSAIFPIFALYKNYSLLACFAGLGIGYALTRREAIPLFLTVPALALQMLLLVILRYGLGSLCVESLWQIPFSEQLNMGVEVAASAPYLIAIYSLLTVVFLLTVLAFIPVGQLCGRLMTRRENLRAYGFNLLGSILGVVLITGISFLWTPPVVWFSICFALLLVFHGHNDRALLTGVLSSLVAVVILSWPVSSGFEKIHTPYQLLERGPSRRGLTSIRAAGHYYQRVIDLSISNANLSTDDLLQGTADYYDLPYRIYGKPLQMVAIVGAGAGNDVAAALRSGAEHVDAIEIDPGILKLGQLYHPEKPYDDPRVEAIVNDARTFMRSTKNVYDMIVYGLLDSHTVLSHASSVRLDSFVYTVEALKEARKRLKQSGVLSLSFCVLSDQMGRKIYLMMKEAFEGQPPLCIRAEYDGSFIYIQSGEGGLMLDKTLLRDQGFEDVTSYYANPAIEADIPTDDWPFFYMPKRIYPISYLGILGLILLLSTFTTYNFFQQKPAFSSLAFFFLGAGFMLIETKAITELGLTFGNIWQVIGIVIAGILLMAFLANCIVRLFRIKRPSLWFVLLLASLFMGFVISGYGGFGPSLPGKASTIVVLICPMFFSGIVFSTLLGQAKDIAGVMAINLLGAMTGGVLEYNSMYFGFRFLYLLAIVLYLLAFGSFYFKSRIGRTTGKLLT
jgi:spermidine synthase